MADINDLKNMKDHTSEFDPTDIQNNKTMGILSYISWLVLIPIFAAKGSKFARFHANQGLVLAIAQSAVWVTFIILDIFLSWIPVVRVLYWIIKWLVLAALVVPSVIGIVNAARGQAKEFPIIGGIKILK